ncbi:MAG: hypothetical protein H6Q33_4354 [Deltaproteobacteria bacterium]|nr:hypothetical protein [Deltaproteobacteria bacterium]
MRKPALAKARCEAVCGITLFLETARQGCIGQPRHMRCHDDVIKLQQQVLRRHQFLQEDIQRLAAPI